MGGDGGSYRYSQLPRRDGHVLGVHARYRRRRSARYRYRHSQHPRGFVRCDASVLRHRTTLVRFMWGTLSGITEPFGALLVWAVLSSGLSGNVDGILFGIVAGMMPVISVDE